MDWVTSFDGPFLVLREGICVAFSANGWVFCHSLSIYSVIIVGVEKRGSRRYQPGPTDYNALDGVVGSC